VFNPFSVAMVTPFTPAGKVDWAATEQLVDQLIGTGVCSLLISGSTGEQHSMTPEERAELYRVSVQRAAGRADVIAGVAATTTTVARELANAAVSAGATSIMLGIPPYLRPTQLEVIDYVTDVAEATTLPILLYNNPPRTGTDISVETIAALFQAGRISACKYGDLAQAARLLDLTGHKLALYTGSDASYLHAISSGYTGITSIIGNVIPNEMRQISTLLANGQVTSASQLFRPVSRLCEAVFSTATPVGVKYALRMTGGPGGYCRKPLGHITVDQQDLIDRCLKEFNMIQSE